MLVRRTAFGLWLCLMFLIPAGASAQTRVTPEVREWLSALVAKVASAVEITRPPPGKRRLVVVEVRVVVLPMGRYGTSRSNVVPARAAPTTAPWRRS